MGCLSSKRPGCVCLDNGGKMKLGSRKLILDAAAAMLVCVAAFGSAAGQTAPAKKPAAAPAKKPAASGQAAPARRPAAAAAGPVMADRVYTNVKVLRGLTEDQFMDTMGFIASALGTNCIFCHDNGIGGDTSARWKAFAADTKPTKETARKMILMVNAINKQNFAGQKMVTCYSCHRSLEDPPKVIPEMAAQYMAPVDSEPDAFTKQAPDSPTPDQILAKYIDAMGGATRVGNMKSYVAKGTYGGYDTDFAAVPMEIYAKAPDKRSMVMHTPFGERSEIFNGKDGWNATPDTSQVLPVLPITGGRLTSAKAIAQFAFPTGIKDSLTRWIVSPEFTTSSAEPGAEDAGERQVYVLQGNTPRRLPIKLYFDKNTGLLVRIVSYVDTVLGLIPAQTDYSNYKDVNGIKMPFHWAQTWTDGKSVFDLTDVQVNAAVDDAKFGKPAAPKLLTPPSSR